MFRRNRGWVRRTALPTALFRGVVTEGLARSRNGPVWPNLRPAITEYVAQLPTSLNSRAQQLFIWRPAIAPVLPKVKEHLCQRPACAEQVVSLLRQFAALLHESVAQCDVKVQRSLPKLLWQGAILSTVQAVQALEREHTSGTCHSLVVKLKADTKNRVCRLVVALPHIKKRLAEVTEEIEVHFNTE